MDFVRSRTMTTRITDRMTLLTDMDSPPNPTHCPYCETMVALTAAYRYLVRTKTRPGYAGVYQELARQKVAVAVTILSEMPDPPGSRQSHLLKLVNGIDVLLAQPATIDRLQAIAKGIWDTTDLAMDLAEYANVPPSLAEPPPSADVIDGEFIVKE